MTSCENVIFAIQATQTRSMRRTALNMFNIIDKCIAKQKAEGFTNKCILSMFISVYSVHKNPFLFCRVTECKKTY